ncbi:MAG: DUF58 domain-containing protein [Gammaproteobacteria bacterium]
MFALPPRFLYRAFPLAAGASAWSTQRLSSSGRLFAVLLVGGLLFGFDTRQTLAWLVAVVSFAVLAASLLSNLRWRPALRIRRVLPDVVTANAAFSYFVEISNDGQRTERDLSLRDGLLAPQLDYTSFLRRRGSRPQPGENRFDRAIGFTRWLALRDRDRGATFEVAEVPAIAPGGMVRVEIRTRALRRGYLRFGAVTVLRPDALGLSRARYVLPSAGEVLALPQRHAMPALRFSAQRHYQRGGVSLALAVGDSQEFASLRDYRPGDPRRHIHWRSFARTGRLIVREFRDEYFDRHALIVDTHVDVNDEQRFEAIITVAASIAGGERPRDAILDLIFAGSEVIELSAGRGLGDALQLSRWLAEARIATRGSFADINALLRERASQLASLVVVLGHRDAARETLLDELRARGLPMLSLTVVTDGDVPPLSSLSSPWQRNALHRAFVIRTGHLVEDLARVAFDP